MLIHNWHHISSNDTTNDDGVCDDRGGGGREKLLKAIKVTIIVLRGEKQATETLRHAGKRE